MDSPYSDLRALLEKALAGTVTGGSARTWIYDLAPPTYGRKWMTRRARRWKTLTSFARALAKANK